MGRFTAPPRDSTAEPAEAAERAARSLEVSLSLASSVGCFSFRGVSAPSASSAVFSVFCFFFARSRQLFSYRAWPRHPPAGGFQLPAACRPAPPLSRSRVPGDLGQAAAAQHGFVIVINVVALDHVLIMLFDQRPLVSLLPGRRPFIFTSAKSPFNFSPSRRNFKSPLASIATASASVPGTYFPCTATGDSGCQVPHPKPSPCPLRNCLLE